jgi:hypothetical protein
VTLRREQALELCAGFRELERILTNGQG